MSLLSTIMSWQQFKHKSSLMSQIMRLDGAFLEYERLGSKLNDELKTAILLRSVTGQLRMWLQLQVSETTTYSNVREHILSYERSTSKWTEQMVLGNDLSSSGNNEAVVPMDVDRLKEKEKARRAKEKETKDLTKDPKERVRVTKEMEKVATKDPGINPRVMVSPGVRTTAMVETKAAKPLPKEKAMAARTPTRIAGNVVVLDILLKSVESDL